MVLSNPTSSASPESDTVRQRRTKLITEVVTTQREIISQPVIIRNIGTIVIAQSSGPISDIKAIHFSVIPLTMNGLPVMSDILSVVRLQLLRSDPASLAIGLRVSSGNPKGSCLRIVAKIRIE